MCTCNGLPYNCADCQERKENRERDELLAQEKGEAGNEGDSLIVQDSVDMGLHLLGAIIGDVLGR